MNTFERKLPQNYNATILGPLLGHKTPTETKYLKEIEKFETGCEKSLIDTLARIGIDARVKSERFSLPYKEELKVELYGESWMGGPYEFYRVAYRILKELLEKEVYKLRFYIYVEHDTSKFPMGSMTYHFRYYIH
jgi:hypothetical protein